MLSIAALKKVGKGTRMLLMDRNGGLSKAVAKDLDRKGFKKARTCAVASPAWYTNVHTHSGAHQRLLRGLHASTCSGVCHQRRL